MLVRCDCCGGENQTDPGHEMLVCAYCGTALAIEKRRGPERLILAHERSDSRAEAALRSFLIEKGRRRPVALSTAFSFMPFAMIEDADGATSLAPACASCANLGGTPYPPAGHYRFSDGTNPPGEPVVPEETTDPRAARIIHLPVYLIRYKSGGWNGDAAVVGESWQVIAGTLPPERPQALDLRALGALTGLFIAYFIIGALVPRAPARLSLVAGAALAAYGALVYHERAARRG